MVKDQQEAEKKKVQSQEIQLQLSEQTVHIEQKRTEVMADLAQVEPAVIDAQTGKLSVFFPNKSLLHSCFIVIKFAIVSRKIYKETASR